MKPKALDHVGLKVTDMDRSLHFYCDGLGLELLRRSDKGPGVASAVLRIGDQEMNLFSSPAFVPGLDDGNPPGLDHFCLEVEAGSIDDVIASLRRSVSRSPSRP
jgi:catechol 2,3-dioxygenase-like lactoylglutathione lyase family enzyme